jgi:Mg-chelatase subunit ChlD
LLLPVLWLVAAVASAALPGPVTAAPAAQDEGRCRVSVDKTALPARVELGRTVEVRLSITADCPPATGTVSPSDIVLVIDRSASMRDNELFAPTIAAARVFLELTDFSQHQVGLVTFFTPLISPQVEVVQPLSSDGAAVRAALEAIPQPLEITGSTDLTSALRGAQGELASPRHRPEAQPVLVLLTDGEHNAILAGSPTAEAQRIKDAGTLILTIGLGVGSAARDTLEQIASREDLYFDAPTTDDLRKVYRAIAGQLSAPGEMADLEIVDILPTEVELVDGSVEPPPTEATRSALTWRLPRLPAGGWSARYLVRPLQTGRYATNKLAYVDYLDADGSIGSRPFPVPEIEVIEPDDRFRAFLPSLWRNYCKPSRPFDVVLALDASGSMAGQKLADSTAAAKTFVRFLELPPSRAGVVAFNSFASPLVDLSTDRAAVLAALDGMSTAPGTRIDRALRGALSMLSARPEGADAERQAVIILLTDGKQNGADEQEVWNAAAALRRSGLDLAVYAIGVGDDVDAGLLRQIVAPFDERFYPAAGSGELERIYSDIAGSLPCGR